MEAAGTSSMVVNEEDHDLMMMMELPPGFRFHPTDEEIITHYLIKKIMDDRFTPIAIVHVDMNKCEPWDLPKKSKMKEKEWYFFCQRDRKYPTGTRTNRATGTGYWKATGKDKEIYKGKNVIVGMKKTLVFYKGRAPKGEKSNWVMHEYRLQGSIPYYKGPKDEWVVCKIFHKNTGIRRNLFTDHLSTNDSFIEEILVGSPSPLPPLMDDNTFTTSFKNNSSNLQIQENQNSFFLPNFSDAFKASYQALNYHPIQENPIFLNNYQECPNSSVSAANQNSMISPSQDTEISSNRVFEDLEGISVNHNMSELEILWDY